MKKNKDRDRERIAIIDPVTSTHYAGKISHRNGAKSDIQGEWPADWTTVEYKRYPRLGPTIRSRHKVQQTALRSLFEKRCTVRHFRSSLLAAADVIDALDVALADRKRMPGGRACPSAGARYPVECYLLAVNIPGIPGGTFHYSPRTGALTLLFPSKAPRRLLQSLHRQSFGAPAGAFIFTIALRRSAVKYGARGYRFSMMEAGASAMALNLALLERGIAAAWIGGFDDDAVSRAIGVASEQELEFPALLIAFGHDAQTT